MIRRRGLCAGLAALPAAARADDDNDVDADAKALAAHCVGAIRAALAAQPAGPVLLNSYVVNQGSAAGDFDLTQANAAYVYDNALAGLALLAAGQAADAARIGQALALAQAGDRFWHDGRLRNAYQAGPMATPAKLPGWWDAKAGAWREDPYQVGSQTGPLAWAMLLWLRLDMAAAARQMLDFLNARLRAPSGYYGGFYGFEPRPLPLMWQSTEQNTDMVAACRRLGAADDAMHAAGFVQVLRKGDLFGAGRSPAGDANPLLAADAGIWPYLAGLAPAATAQAAISALRRGGGIGFSAASDGPWLEGTAFAALALRRAGDAAGAAGLLRTVAAQLAPVGYVYATVAPMLATGLTVGPALVAGQAELPFNYFRRPSLSATAWTALAGLNANPLEPV